MVFSTSKFSSAWSQRDQLQATIIGCRFEGLLLLPGQSLSVPLEASHIPIVRTNGVGEAHGQPEAGEIQEHRQKCRQNRGVSSPPVTLLGGLSEPSNSSQGFCFSLVLHKAVPAKRAQPGGNVASTSQGKGGNEKSHQFPVLQGARKLYSPSDLHGMVWDCS